MRLRHLQLQQWLPTKLFTRSASNLDVSIKRLCPSLSLLADKCSSMDQLKQIHSQMIITARIHDNFAASRLLSFSSLSATGDLDYAIKLFYNTQNPNNFMWNTLIRAQAGGPNPTRALYTYVEMKKLGFAPNNHTYPFVIKACSQIRSLSYCRQVHDHVFKHGFGSDIHVVNGLVRGYTVCSDLGSARKLFDESHERDLSVWTTMICGYAQNFCLNDALDLFDKMIFEGFEPNGPTLASVLSACARSGCLELGENIHAYMNKKKIEVGAILGTALVHMYASNGAILVAKNVFGSMNERNCGTWNAMISGLARNGYAQEALDLFGELEKQNILPNEATFVGVLSACCHAGLISIGRKIFASMKMVYGIEPMIEHYGCMVDLLSRSGELLEAEGLVKGMGLKPDIVIWGTLLSACKNYKNVEVCERVAKEMLALEPNNHGVYVVLSNIYAETGRWKEIERLRKMMKKEKLIKAPGWSLVEAN